MKCCVLTKIAFVVVILITVVSCNGIGKSEKLIARQNFQDTPAALTVEEETTLNKLLDNTLSWIQVWAPGPFNFLKENKIIAYHMPTVFKQQEGHEVEVRLIITNAKLVVYMAQLHIRLTFIRFRGLGLGPPAIIFFGEDSNDNRLIAERQEAQQLKSQDAYSMDFPELPENLRKELDKKAASLPKGEGQKIENRIYKVPVLGNQLAYPHEPWGAEQEDLYQQVVSIVDDQVKHYYCESGLKIRVTIPYFNLGDPEIYVLVSMSGKAKKFVEMIGFTRDFATGQISAYQGKQISRLSELEYWSPQIETNKYTEREIVCE
jgi:hypothetical protein